VRIACIVAALAGLLVGAHGGCCDRSYAHDLEAGEYVIYLAPVPAIEGMVVHVSENEVVLEGTSEVGKLRVRYEVMGNKALDPDLEDP